MVKCPPLNRKLGVRSTGTERIAVALLRQERSPQSPQQEAQFWLRPAVNCRHQKKRKGFYYSGIFGTCNICSLKQGLFSLGRLNQAPRSSKRMGFLAQNKPRSLSHATFCWLTTCTSFRWRVQVWPRPITGDVRNNRISTNVLLKVQWREFTSSGRQMWHICGVASALVTPALRIELKSKCLNKMQAEKECV